MSLRTLQTRIVTQASEAAPPTPPPPTCSLTLIGSLAIAVNSQGCFVNAAETFLFFNDTGASAFRKVDVSNKAVPVLDSSLALAAVPFGLWLEGSTAYLTTQLPDALRVIDTTTSPPTGLGTLALASNPVARAQSVSVAGSRAYVARIVAAGDSPIDIIDVSIPGAPLLLGSFNINAGFPTNQDGPAESIFAVGSLLYVLDSPGLGVGTTLLAIYDATNPGAVTQLGTVALGTPLALSGSKALFVSGGFAYAYNMSGASGIFVVDVSNPALPVATTPLTGVLAAAITVVGSLLFITDHAGAIDHVRSYDVIDPLLPVAGPNAIIANTSFPTDALAATVDFVYLREPGFVEIFGCA